MDVPIRTSQHGSHSLPEGKGNPQVPQQHGTETSGAPMPVTEPIKGEVFKIDALQTSQQKRGEHDKDAA